MVRGHMIHPAMRRFHRVPCFGAQYLIAEANYLEKLGILEWSSGPRVDDEDSWLTDAQFLIRNQKAYDKFIVLTEQIFYNLKDDGDKRPNWIYLHKIEKKLKRFRGRYYGPR